MFEILTFNGLTNIELEDEFMTSADKLKEVLENSTLPNFIKKFKPYFNQVGLNSKYFTEDDFNHRIKGYNTRFSIFHLNIRSLNKHHNDLIIYLYMLDMKFDLICLSEIWKFNSEFIKIYYLTTLPTSNHQQIQMLVVLQFLLNVISKSQKLLVLILSKLKTYGMK